MFDEPEFADRSDRFPSAEVREIRRESLHRMIDRFFGEYVPADDGGGYPIVTAEHKEAIYEIFGEIIDLKFARDGDGDRGVVFAIGDRNMGRFVHHFIPFGPRLHEEEWSEKDIAEWTGQMVRTSQYMLTVANYPMIDLQVFYESRASSIQQTIKRETSGEETFEIAAKGTFAEASAAVLKLHDEIKEPQNPIFERINAKIRSRFPEELRRTINEIDPLLMDDAVAYSDELDGTIRTKIREAGRIFGPTALSQTNGRFNYLADMNRVRRRAASMERWKADRQPTAGA